VRVVQLPPAMLHVALVPEFRRCRRTPQLDEGGVCAIAKFDQLRVDAGTLQDPYSLRHRRLFDPAPSPSQLACASVRQCPERCSMRAAESEAVEHSKCVVSRLALRGPPKRHECVEVSALVAKGDHVHARPPAWCEAG
jgi:hypothetical protein